MICSRFAYYLIHSSCDRNACLTQDMGYLRVTQTGSVVFEGELILLLVDAKPSQTVGVGEFAETVKLLKTERKLQFISDLD